MRINVSSYIPGSSLIHTADARVKLLLLAMFSIALFLVQTWTGLAICMAMLALVLKVSGVSAHQYFRLIVPVYFIVLFTLVFNSFSFSVAESAASVGQIGLGNVSAGVFDNLAPIVLLGNFGFDPSGFARGCFYAGRILMLVLASLVVTYSTTSTDLTRAFCSFMAPLRVLRLPVDDIAMVFSLALRYIPVTAEELGRVYDAQWARGASFDEGKIWERLKAWQAVFIPLFVGLFRRADALAVAMDARCYGVPKIAKTALNSRALQIKDALIISASLVLFVAVSYLL